MIKKRSDIASRSQAEPEYEVTASLLNSWQTIFDAPKWCRESDGDAVSLEAKQSDAAKKKYDEFLCVLKRIPAPDNEYMKRGREFESDVYAGKDEVFSPIVDGGEYQAAFSKRVKINGMTIVMYGILDALKAGKIYDIKRVVKWSTGKYKGSHQHPMYLYLVPEAMSFTYLVRDDAGNHHFETYERQNCENIVSTTATFLSWLSGQGLMETYKQCWEWSRKKHLAI